MKTDLFAECVDGVGLLVSDPLCLLHVCLGLGEGLLSLLPPTGLQLQHLALRLVVLPIIQIVDNLSLSRRAEARCGVAIRSRIYAAVCNS